MRASAQRKRRAGTVRTRAANRAERAIVAEEQDLLERVQAAIQGAAARRASGRAGGGGEFETLREELFEAREDDVGLVLALMHQQAARDGTASLGALPELQAPYFAHLCVASEGKRRDILLGPRPFPGLGPGLSIVDYCRAPIAEAFFSCEEGDDYEIEANRRSLEGVVEARRVVTFAEGQLASVTVAGGTVVRAGKGWRFVPNVLGSPLTGAPAAPLTQQLADAAPGATTGSVAVDLLDRQQRALLVSSPDEPLLILGSAGCGKTTVALHRVARLCRKWPDRYPPKRCLVVVPERGLRRLSERLLGELGLSDVTVLTFREWVEERARALLSWLPARLAPDRPQAVSKMKRHPALFAAIDCLIDDRAAEIAAHLDHRLKLDGAVVEAMAARHDHVLAQRLRQVQRRLAKQVPRRKRKQLEEACAKQLRELSKVREDFYRLIGDRELLEIAADMSGGDLGSHHVEATLYHTSRQLDEPAEIRYAHVDSERLATLDGRGIDEGTPDELARTIDSEDFALLLELLYRKLGKTATRARKLPRVPHLVVDEAQELAPIELRVLGRTRRQREGAVTVAGDAAQQVDSASWFTAWPKAMAALGVPDAASSCLETTYRCPHPVAELAHQILGPLAPSAPPHAVRDGAPVSRSVVTSEGHGAVLITEVLARLTAEQPMACVAVIARDVPGARQLHQVLSNALAPRLVLAGRFSFAPGIEVTDVAEVKGLEFDYVIVPDASLGHYPDTPEARRLLHVAVTRAAHQVWIVCPGTPSPVLPKP
ncbi:MAG: AAA family ATPase [Deltaproteobacteria bacterium]|nr:AAA family ATPase [Deltaproteobacteria bacterium]